MNAFERGLRAPGEEGSARSLRLDLPVALGSTHEPLARHAQNRFLVGQGAEPLRREPQPFGRGLVEEVAEARVDMRRNLGRLAHSTAPNGVTGS